MRIKTQKEIELGVNFLCENSAQLKLAYSMVDDVPLRLGEPNFEGLASIIVSQQVSKASADAIFGRLKKLVKPLTVKQYMKAGEAVWIEAGLSRPKQRTFIALCEAIENGDLDLEALCDLSADEAIEQMTAVKGIGPWTAEVYLLFSAGHCDIFPAGDLALQEAIKLSHNLETRPSDKQVREIAKAWAPWRGVAARLLWRYYAVMIKRDATPN